MKFSRKMRIIALILALVILISLVLVIRSCSLPPKYEDIEKRFKELMEASYGVNVILFGDGLPVYERVSDPQDSLQVYNTGEFYTDEDGDEHQRRVWYYYTLNENYTVVAFRDSYLEDFSYGYVADSELSLDELKAAFPAIEGLSAPLGSTFYSRIFHSEQDGSFVYLVPYKETEAEFYYNSTDPKNYDYVKIDSEYRTLEDIKKYAQTVYSRNYMLSLYSSLFDGIESEGVILNARYVEQTRSDSSVFLAQLNTYESLFSERRLFLYDTAEIIKWGSNNKFVRISIDTYFASNPEKIQQIEVNLVLQDGQWYLDSPTF